ncbi:hypothetical protein TcasGA2_TC011273 [Tribolium castaneum]|uniref:DUF4371 domain-containing protein n=1 Tax=Tribolium castaneum TaxID=7070 RepID=D6X3N7_TRICA|nr:hypothetical protein TcasGA2_TC011273 [Tribolium castaneum]
MSCGRTKCAAICENVLVPFSVQLVLEDLETSSFFSIASDASNKGNRKLFPLCIRYFDVRVGIKEPILDFYEDANETSQAIYHKIKMILQKCNLPIDKISSYAADNASVNYGKHNSVFIHLKNDVPGLISANCNCHVINNASKFAAKVLSMDVETLIIKIYNEFSSSAKNDESLKDFGEFVEIEWAQILRHVPTWWLSLYPAICRITEKWPALKSYFLSQGEDNCDKLIWKFVIDDAASDPSENNVSIPEKYLYFVHHISGLFHNVVLALENKTCASPELYEIIENLIVNLKQKRQDNFYKANAALRRLSNATNANKINSEFGEF